MKAKRSGGNGNVLAATLLVIAASFSIPFVAHITKKENLNSTEKALNATQIRRGAYQNSGSKDVGVDPDWDFRTNTWQGRRAGDIRSAKQHEPSQQHE